jgi:group II intron reverse transcriptase/maturase
MDIARVQKSLATKASYQPQHRFNDLYRYVWHRAWLEAARQSVLRNKGARTAGVDGVVPKDLTETEWQEMLDQLTVELKERTYQPMPVRRMYVPKPNGKMRPLGIPTARDRVVQEVVKMVLEPIYESHFLSCSHGFRPGRSTMSAINRVQYLHNQVRKYYWVVEGDIKACFDEIPHRKLIQALRKVIKDERLLSLIWTFLKAGYMEDEVLHVPDKGTPQGGIVSPLLANVYLHEMDKVWWERYGILTQTQRRTRRRKGLGNVQLVRYADDFLILTNGTKEQARELMEEFRVILEELGLTLSPEKTRLTHVDGGYEFLGFHLQRRPRRCAPQQKALYVTPTQGNIQRYREKIKDLLGPTQGDPINKIRAVNRVVRGWANYYRHVQSARVRQKLDYWTFRAVWKWLYRKHGGNVGWKELYNRYITRNAKGWKVLGYKSVHLARMNDVHYRRYYLPKGGIQNPYLKLNRPATTLTEDDPIADETWDGTSTQKGFALIRQDLLAQCGPICHRCKREFPPYKLHAHHVTALKDGGQDKQSNLELLCQDCHTRTKNYGSKTPEM